MASGSGKLTGVVVEQGDVAAMAEAIESICGGDREQFAATCRARVVEHFDKDKCFEGYVGVYEQIINGNFNIDFYLEKLFKE